LPTLPEDDITPDPQPRTGGTTTCKSLWIDDAHGQAGLAWLLQTARLQQTLQCRNPCNSGQGSLTVAAPDADVDTAVSWPRPWNADSLVGRQRQTVRQSRRGYAGCGILPR
jgi:hypothetical protein